MISVVESKITVERILQLLNDPPGKLGASAGLRKLAWCLEVVRANRAAREARKRPRTTEERAQTAIDELRRTIPKIAASYRNPEHAEFLSDDEREQFKRFAAQIEDWLDAAPHLWDRENVSELDWYTVARWAWQFYRDEVDAKAGISKSGPSVTFIQGVLRLGGLGEHEGSAIEKALRPRKTKSIATKNF